MSVLMPSLSALRLYLSQVSYLNHASAAAIIEYEGLMYHRLAECLHPDLLVLGQLILIVGNRPCEPFQLLGGLTTVAHVY